LQRAECGPFFLQHPAETGMSFEIVSGMSALTTTALLTQRAFNHRNKFLSAVEAAIGALARPQRQDAHESINAIGL
jgi:hypothetical protein